MGFRGMNDLRVSTRGQIFHINEINTLSAGIQKVLTAGKGRRGVAFSAGT